MKTSSTPNGSVRSIVCPVDFSAQSRVALRAADVLARRFGARLTVMFADDPLLSQAARLNFDAEAMGEAAEAELRRFVQRAIGSARGGRAIACEIVSGQPAAEIGKAAERRSADLVVMGTLGLSGARKLVVGSTTETVLRETRVPVLVVPPGAARLVRAGRWPGKKILAAIDLGDRAAVDVGKAAQVARTFGASLVLVHVVRPTPGPPWLRVPVEDTVRAQTSRARVRLRELAGTLKGTTVKTLILLGDPAREIAALGASAKAGLVVLVLRGGRGLFGPRQGSFTYRVLSSTATPILAIPAAR